jgi:hypothetical protein
LAGVIFECQFFCYRHLSPTQVWLMSTPVALALAGGDC